MSSTSPLLMPDGLADAEALRVQGRLAEAEALCRAVLTSAPENPRALHLLAVTLHQQGRIREAIENASRATELAPEEPLFHANLGEMWRLAGRPDMALASGARALALKPDYPEALSNVGIAHYELKAYEAAADHHRRAVTLRPDFAEAHSNLGNALYAQRRFAEAAASYRRAVALKPTFAEAWSNLGTALHHDGCYDEAITMMRRAIALDPSSANARSGLGILLLMRGELAEGWEEYEWRLKSTEVRLPYAPQRPWRGEALHGRSIYVHAEQGFGDSLQFARYLPLLAGRGARVTFRVQQGLVGLMRQSFPAIQVLGDRGAPTPLADVECALLSLPCLLKTRLETIPATTPYLTADPGDAAAWRARLGGLAGLKVGLAWAGNPEHANDARRSIALAKLRPLFEVAGVSLVSLQVGARAADLKDGAQRAIADIAGELVGFAATAAAMTALDLVISVDSAVAHLAGGLGKPVWLLTPWVSDWRWFLGREDSPWYPTMRLYRQAPGQDWAEIAERVAADLARVAAGDATLLTPFRETGEARARWAAEIIGAGETQSRRPAGSPSASAGQLIALAEQRRQLGKLAEADLMARRALELDPAAASGHHLLGIVAHQSGNLAHAIDHIAQAAALAPENALFHANLGEMLRLAGRVGEAQAETERALALEPDYPDALSNLGILRYQAGAYDAALACYDRAIALRPAFVAAHSNRGNALRSLKRLDEAVAAYRQALALQPGFAEAWNNLGTTLRDLKRLDDAVEAYRRALALKPDDPETLNSLALALHDLERSDEAVETLQRSLAIEPGHPRTRLYLGVVLTDLHRLDEAHATLHAAREVAVADADVINAQGRVAFERGDACGALALHRRALEINPDLADACNNMGNALRELGRVDEARAAFTRALTLDPACSGVYVNLADCHRFSKGDPVLKAMQDMAAGPLAPIDRMHLDFALAKALADIGDAGRSFSRLKRANEAKRARIQYDEAAAAALFDAIEATFTPELMAAKTGLGDPSGRPIFVIGMPRSGTTLAEQILASHPQVFGAGELTLVRELAGPGFPQSVPALGQSALRRLAAQYLQTIESLAPDAARVTDKMPSNYYFAGLIHLAMPGAKIVHMTRDPRDVCLSCYSKLFSAEQDHTYDLGELGRYWRRYDHLMEHWRRVLPSGVMLEVCYEELVADLEGQARRILAHVDLDWDDACLRFHETDRPIRTASAVQVRRPISDQSVGRWRNYRRQLAPLLAALQLADDT